MRIYLYIVYCFLLCSCTTSPEPQKATFSSENIPDINLFSLDIEDSNDSKNITFHSLGLGASIENFIDLVLKENPGWITKLAKMEEVRAGLDFYTNSSRPNFRSSLGWLHGKEKTRESDFKKANIPEFQSNVNFNWELDMWGKWKQHKKEALQILEAEIYMLKSSQLALIYEAAELWYEFQFYSEDLNVIKNQISNHHEYHILHLHKYNNGLDDNSSIIEMENQIKQLVLEYNRINREQSVYGLKLSTLIGKPFDQNLTIPSIISHVEIPIFPPTYPTKFIENRPDVLEAKSRFLAHTHHTYASRLDLYPSLQLNLNGIAMSGDLSNPFKQWKISGGPSFSIPLWDPQRKTQLKFDRKRLTVLKNLWSESIIRAIMEIESSAIYHNSNMENFKISQSIEAKSFYLLSLSEAKMKSGLISKIDYLKKHNESLEATRISILARKNAMLSFLNLAKNLGVNWD